MEKGEKVILTGMPGFIATHLAPRLVERGLKVYALIRYVTGRRVNMPKGVIQVHGDLRDAFTIRHIVSDVMPDYVVHLAALSPVAFSYDRPKEYMDVNLQGTINLAESCLRQVPHFKQFLFASTSECYGNQRQIPIKEDACLYPNSPYAVSKAGATMYLEYMRDAYGFPVTLCVPFNTYGRIENTHFVTERILSQMLSGEKEIRLGDPDPVRDMLYREDHVNAYLMALENGDALGEKINFCTGIGYSIAELVSHCAELTGWNGDVVWYTVPKRPLDIDVLIGDNTKARGLGWMPKYDLVSGLRETIKGLKRE